MNGFCGRRCATAASKHLPEMEDVDDDQPALYARLVSDGRCLLRQQDSVDHEQLGRSHSLLPALFRAAGITVLLSVLSMALAVAIGVLLATGASTDASARNRPDGVG